MTVIGKVIVTALIVACFIRGDILDIQISSICRRQNTIVNLHSTVSGLAVAEKVCNTVAFLNNYNFLPKEEGASF